MSGQQFRLLPTAESLKDLRQLLDGYLNLRHLSEGSVESAASVGSRIADPLGSSVEFEATCWSLFKKWAT
jgi:hypothetical protein